MSWHPANDNRRWITLAIAALALAAWLTRASVPTLAQPGGALVSVWLTTPDQLNLLAPQHGVAFQADTGENATTIDIDSRTTFQQIDGFGASFTDSSAWLVSTKLTPGKRNELMSRLFDPVAGIGLSYLRQPMGASDFALSSYTYDDVPAGQTDVSLTHFSIEHDRAYILPLLKQARLINSQLRIIATPWSPPAWMKTSQSMIGGALNTSAMVPLAGYFVKFLQAYEAEGVPIDRITIQNEPHFTPVGYPGMFMEWDQQDAFVRDFLGPALANAGLTTGIALWDHNWNEPSYPTNILADAGAAQYVSGSAFHCYAGTPDAMTTVHDANPGKDLYLTECSGSTDMNWAETLKFDLETLIIGSTRNWARTVIKWNVALDTNRGPQNGGCSNCTGLVTIDQSSGAISYNVDYYTIGHASKFVMPGARRIASNTFGPGSIEDVAFKNPDGSIALIVLNADTAPRTFKVRVGAQSFLYELPASGVATFTWQDSTTWTNQLPAVALTAPASGASYVAPGVISLSATASDSDGYITSVSFYAGTSLIGSSARPPYAVTWSGVPAGSYNLTAVAVDNLGGSSTSAPVSVSVSTPFSGTPAALPGTIQAAQFDNGGAGIAYHDTTPGNSGGAFRTTDVDIEGSSLGGYDVGWIADGEWLRYSVNVATAGSYTLQFHVASPLGGGRMHAVIGGITTETIAIPNTGDWQAWTLVTMNATLAAGPQTMTLVFDTGGFNVADVTATSAGSTPYSGTPIALPGTFQAGAFDNGGEGIAYHDTTPGNSGGAFRNTDVDIEGSSLGGYDVGWIADGEWLRYSVNVATAGAYTLQFHVASPYSAGRMHAVIGGVTTETIAIPNTGDWQTWTLVTLNATLAPGPQTMTLVFDTGGFNVADMTAVYAGSTPYSGTPIALPGTFSAETFDNGGEGVAYHDTTPGNSGGAFRDTSVDIEGSSLGGYDVGWIADGEWLRYSVNVATAGSYTLQFHVASPYAVGRMHAVIGGVTTETIVIPNTGGWQTWTLVTVNATLAAGPQTMTLVFDTGGFNVADVTVAPSR